MVGSFGNLKWGEISASVQELLGRSGQASLAHDGALSALRKDREDRASAIFATIADK